MIKPRTFAFLAALMVAASSAGAQELRDDRYPVTELASVMGELHYFAFTCESRNAQEWRRRMSELLELEAPTRGSYRDRLIRAFNDGFRQHERRRTRCGAEAELEQQRLARRGEALAEALRQEYIE
ncbi:MAG: TIGR02301 family protein [Pseudomonadota bacterium]